MIDRKISILAVVFGWLAFVAVSGVWAAPPQVNNKLQFSFTALPNLVMTDTAGALQLCLINNGADGFVLYDGGGNLDQIVFSIPAGQTASDLINNAASIYCESKHPDWACTVRPVGDAVTVTVRPALTTPVAVAAGATIYFVVDGGVFNAEPGAVTVGVEQQIAPSRAANPVNSSMSVVKVSEAQAIYYEIDPTVPYSIKDGISWTEVSGIPSGFADGVDNGITKESDPTVPPSIKDGISWSEVSGIPSGFADGVDNGITSESDPTVPPSIKDGISWSEVTDIPSGFADGVDNGIILETDPQVGTIATNSIPKWNGSELVSSGSIIEDGSKRVGIGATTPQQQLDVQGALKIGYVAEACTSAKAGSIRWNGTAKQFEGCDGSAWQGLSSIGGSNDGGRILLSDLARYYVRTYAGARTVSGRQGFVDLKYYQIEQVGANGLALVEYVKKWSGTTEKATVCFVSTVTGSCRWSESSEYGFPIQVEYTVTLLGLKTLTKVNGSMNGGEGLIPWEK
ncbi:MAG: hypothetical protein OEV73_06305 [Desulfobulbaceae bacterium]|nr:hypothetical protein [Desulfobulbaceae bacterium]